MEMCSRILTISNVLTLIRIMVSPCCVLLAVNSIDFNLSIGVLIVFLFALLTDFLDGYLARKRNEITRLGMLLDPIADKLLTFFSLFAFVSLDYIPLWIVLAVLAREVSVTITRSIWYQKGIDSPASQLGKIKFTIIALCLLSLLIKHCFEVLIITRSIVFNMFYINSFVNILIYAMLIITVISGFEFYYLAFRYNKNK